MPQDNRYYQSRSLRDINNNNNNNKKASCLYKSNHWQQFYLCANHFSKIVCRLQVVLLHGQAFTSKTWEELGTMALLAANGYQALAMDLPGAHIIRENMINSLTENHSVCALWFKLTFIFLGGYGKSPDSETLKTDQNRVDLLSRFMESLGVRTAVLVSPSMSGHYSIPFLMKNNAQLRGFVPVAPVGTRNYTPQQYQNIQVSSLRFYSLNGQK